MPTTTTPAEHTYVIDTSVLLSDPRAMLRFKEQEVVLPAVRVDLANTSGNTAHVGEHPMKLERHDARGVGRSIPQVLGEQMK